MGQWGKKNPSFFICCAVVDRRQHPGQERREKGVLNIRQDIRYRLKKKELQMNVTLSYLLEMYHTAAVIPVNPIHPLQTHHQLQITTPHNNPSTAPLASSPDMESYPSPHNNPKKNYPPPPSLLHAHHHHPQQQ